MLGYRLPVKAGFADYLSKPLDSAALENAVKENIPESKILSVTNDLESVATETREALKWINEKSVKERLLSVSEMNYEVALSHCAGDEEFLIGMLRDIVTEKDQKIAEMEEKLSEKDYVTYGRLAHSIKGIMATVGFQKLSDEAKRQDEATRTGNIDAVLGGSQEFIEHYGAVCDSIKNVLQ